MWSGLPLVIQLVVLWQNPQSLVVATWFCGLPVALTVSWQLAQVPSDCAWLNLPGPTSQLVVRWQASQVVVVEKCVGDFGVIVFAPALCAPSWHEKHEPMTTA